MADSDRSVLVDPLNYNPAEHGPPYLPLFRSDIRPMKTAAVRASFDEMVAKTAASTGEEMQQIFDHFVADYAQTPGAALGVLLSALRAEAMVHQAHHWGTKGPTFHGDHLLYERIYTSAFEMVDTLAERAVGTGHSLLVHPLIQIRHISGFTSSFYRDASPAATPEEMALFSLRAVLRFLVLLNLTFTYQQQAGTLSKGTDNLLQGIADEHEKFVYLLKQRTGADEVRTASSKVPSQDLSWKAGR